jgi:hypothetical protein
VRAWEGGGVLDLQRSSEISGEFVVIHHFYLLLILLSKREEEILRKFHIENTLVLDRMEVWGGGGRLQFEGPIIFLV